MKRALLAVSAAFLMAVVLVSAGLIDFLAADDSIGDTAVRSLITYWLLTSIVIVVAATARAHWPELILLVASGLVAWGIGEVGIRVLAPKRAMMSYRGVIASRDYHHIYPSNRQMMRTGHDGRRTVVRTNADGLRSDYSRSDFLGFDDRIVVLGDSFTFGLGIEQELAFPQLIENKLRERLGRQNIAVLNAGVNSYSPMLSRLLFEGVVADYRPTLVLLALDPGDIGDDTRYAREAVTLEGTTYFDITGSGVPHYYGAVGEVLRPFLTAIGTYLKYPWRVRAAPQYDFQRFELKIGGVTETNKYFIYRYPLEETRAYFEESLRHITTIGSRTRQMGGRFALIVTPRFHHWNQKECPDNLEGGYTLNDPYQFEYFRFFAEMSDEVEYTIFDMLPAFKSTKRFPLVFPDDPHWNEDGHDFVAGALVDYLMENRLVE